MTIDWTQVTGYILGWLTPINLVLFCMLFGFAYAASKAQQMDGFSWAEFLRDDAGKFSAWRLCTFGSFMTSSWIVMFKTMNASLDLAWFTLYMVAWAGNEALLLYVKKGRES